LNITATATNNTSLTGLTVAAVETVNITGSNNLAASASAASTAATAKATTAATLTSANGSLALATAQESAAKAVSTLAGIAATPTASAEPAVVSASTVTATTAPQIAAATKYVNTTALSNAATAAAAVTLPAGVTAFTLAQYNAAGANALLSVDGFVISGATAATRAGVLATGASNVNVAVGATTNSSDLIEGQLAAAADKVLIDATAANGGIAGDVLIAVNLLKNITAANFTALGTIAYTRAQLIAAATAATADEFTGVALTTNATILDRAQVLDAFADAVVAVVGDYSVAQLNSAAASALTSSTGSTLIAVGDDKVNIATRSDALVSLTGTVKGTAATAAAAALTADIAAANTLAAAQAAAVAATVSAAQFADATQVWLKGVESNNTSVTDVAATQTVGLDAVTGMTNSVTYGATVAAGSIASNAAAGTLTVTGAKLASIAISGTGSTGLTLVDGSTTDTIKTLSVATSAATVVDVAGATALTTVSSTGVGGLSLNGAGTKLATVTTGTGADSIRITTATLKDDATTTVDETVNASVSTGSGDDSIRVETSTTGTGLTTVTAGEGNDTIYIKSVGTGVSSIDAGSGNDTVAMGTITFAAKPSLTIAGGEGTDTIVMAGAAALTATDYLQINSAVSGFEGVRFTSQVGDSAATPATAVDVSKYAIGTVATYTFTAGAANSVSKVGADQKLVLAKVAAVTESTTAPMALDVTASSASGLTASAAGYTVGTSASSTLTTVYGANTLDVSTSGSATIGLVLKGAGAKVAVSATGGSSTAGLSSAVTLTAGAGNDVQTLDVTLNSARGTGTNAATEYTATFNAGTVLNSGTATTPVYTYGEHLEGLTSVKVSGSGVFSITAGSVDKTVAKLTTIDASGMTAFANLDILGAQVNTTNLSTTAISLNNGVAETVLLGGAKDAITTASTVGAIDTITGFQLTASATDSLAIDTALSDTLAVGATTFLKFAPTATTLVGALTQAGASTAGNNLVFAFGGDTYVYVDAGTATGLDDGDTVVKLTGTLNLDLLIQTGVLV
jgi:hypothetical protein